MNTAPAAVTLGSMPPEAASISIHYPQFRTVGVPAGSSALAAWEGTVQPFISDAAAKTFLRLVEADMPFGVSEGTIVCEEDSSAHSRHRASRFLVNMTDRCRLLILSFAPPIHPRAYLLSPEFSIAFLSAHPHPRGDLPIVIGKRRLAALCVYSAAEFKFGGEVDRAVEFLDQASAYLARHLIWLRTRQLYRQTPIGRQLIYSPKPGEMIVDNEVGVRNAVVASITASERKFWDGYWPGRVAKVGPKDHVRLLKADGECWCGSGQRYGSCHRPIEEAAYKT
jgi:hypothetical protein